VEADELRIGQVLYNLINNGFNHTPEGGSITIRLVDKNEAVRIEVSDTGKGISEEELPYIWERYYQTEKSSNKRTAGTGLGLAIVKAVMEEHHTEFGVQSQKGVGTTFWFELNKAV
jgi:two-component system sensor histidine kinase ArlS